MLVAVWRVWSIAWLLAFFLIGFEVIHRLHPYGWYWAGIGCFFWWMTPYFMLAEFMDEAKETWKKQSAS
jgi:hypothetical protein